MTQNQIMSEVENTAIALERAKNILQLALEFIEEEAPQVPYDPSDGGTTLASYLCFGDRSDLLRSLIDTAFFDVRNMYNTLDKLVR